MNLAALEPQPKLASTRYCMANPGAEYLIYQPKGGQAFSVELKAGTYRYEWFDPAIGATDSSGDLEAADGHREFRGPIAGDAVLYLRKLPEATQTGRFSPPAEMNKGRLSPALRNLR